eukprot:180166_1
MSLHSLLDTVTGLNVVHASQSNPLLTSHIVESLQLQDTTLDTTQASINPSTEYSLPYMTNTNTYIRAQNEEESSKYIQKLSIVKSSIVSYFASLRTSLNLNQSLICDEISKQETNAHPSEYNMEHLLRLIARLLDQHSALIHTTETQIELSDHNEHEVSSLLGARITTVDVINPQTLGIHYHIDHHNPQTTLDKCDHCDVLYKYRSQWFQAKIHSISHVDHHVIVFINADAENVHKHQFVSVKMRFGDDTSFSDVYTVNISKCECRKTNQILYVSQDLRRNPTGLYIANKANNTAKPCHVFELESPHSLTTRKQHKWRIKYAAICSAKHVMLPRIIRDQLYGLYGETMSFNCLFKCGGMVSATKGSTHCSCVLFNHHLEENSFRSPCSRSVPCLSSGNTCFGINWDLPSFPEQRDCNDIAYSECHGLLSVGGWEFHYNSDDFYRLSFHCDAYFNATDEWQWERMPKMKTKRSWPSAVMLENYNQLMVIGGKGPIQSVEIFDFEGNKWTRASDVCYARYNAGVCCDMLRNKVYIGGGNGDHVSQAIEYYEPNKDKWYEDIAKTHRSHGSKPLLWMGDNGYLLYIASIQSDSMEYIDVRMNTGWTLLYGEKPNQMWHHVFGTDFAKNGNCRLCL